MQDAKGKSARLVQIISMRKGDVIATMQPKPARDVTKDRGNINDEQYQTEGEIVYRYFLTAKWKELMSEEKFNALTNRKFYLIAVTVQGLIKIENITISYTSQLDARGAKWALTLHDNVWKLTATLNQKHLDRLSVTRERLFEENAVRYEMEQILATGQLSFPDSTLAQPVAIALESVGEEDALS